MKRKEREHLKADPFQIFFEKVLGIFKQYKKEINIGLGIIAGIVVLVALVILIRGGLASRENRLYTKALDIRTSDSLTPDEKLDKLVKIKPSRGISASIQLMIASIYFEKGDIKKAEGALGTFKKSSFQIINDEKQMLEADILNAGGKGKEAIDLLFKLYSNPDTEAARDFLLLKMARLQARTGQTGSAVTNLKKIEEEFPQSLYSREVKQLLAQLQDE